LKSKNSCLLPHLERCGLFGILGCMKIPSRIKEFSAQKIVNLMTIFLCSEMLHPHPKGCGFRICISDIIKTLRKESFNMLR